VIHFITPVCFYYDSTLIGSSSERELLGEGVQEFRSSGVQELQQFRSTEFGMVVLWGPLLGSIRYRFDTCNHARTSRLGMEGG
jgi:hypothetical protein